MWKSECGMRKRKWLNVRLSYFPHSRRGVGVGPYGPEAEFLKPSTLNHRLFAWTADLLHPVSSIKRYFMPFSHQGINGKKK